VALVAVFVAVMAKVVAAVIDLSLFL